MNINKMIALMLGVVVFSAGALFSFLVISYMSEYSSRFMIAGVLLLCGFAGGVIAYRLVSRLSSSRRAMTLLICIVAILILTPILSMFIFGKITYSRFGFTIYGLIPVPVMDITVGPQGAMWFRDKTHWVSMEEVQSHLGSGVKLIIIGTGWDNAVRVDPKAYSIPDVEIRALPTPEAFELFNQLKSNGIPVILIAHTTC